MLALKTAAISGARLAIAVLVVALATTMPASAGCQGSVHQSCSKTFTATMRCDDSEGLAAIQGNHCPAGKTCPYCPSGRDCPLIDPWEPTPIKIVGVELVVTSGQLAWAFAGNNHVPDVMVAMGGEQTRVQQWYPIGFAFVMPSAGTPGQHHIDLHVACKQRRGWLKVKWISMYYTVYYTMADPG